MESSISMSLCFALWDAAILDVRLHSKVKRTEPSLPYWNGFDTSQVLTQLIPMTKNATRQIMEMDKSHSFLGDLSPLQRC